jgi:hypothetical protein
LYSIPEIASVHGMEKFSGIFIRTIIVLASNLMIRKTFEINVATITAVLHKPT